MHRLGGLASFAAFAFFIFTPKAQRLQKNQKLRYNFYLLGVLLLLNLKFNLNYLFCVFKIG
jgi:hypothetical protein